MIFEDFSSAHQTVLWSVFAIAFFMGLIVTKTNFCTMGAVSDLVNIGDKGRLRAWTLAMAVAIIGVTVIETMGFASLDATIPPYRGSNFAWLEAIIGGVMFGIGMTLGSGCGNKTLIRIGGGNLKSIVLFCIVSICAYFMLNPFPGTDSTLYSSVFYSWTNPATVSLTTRQDLGSVIGSAIGTDIVTTRTVVGLMLAALILWFVFKAEDFRSHFDNKLAGFSIGAAVIAAWIATTSMVTISSDDESASWTQYAQAEAWDMMEDDADARPRDVGPQSFTFINPIGQTLRYATKSFDPAYVTFGVIAIVGVILGSFVWSLISKAFRIEWFVDFKDFFTHVIGGILMGTGGVLALGCTIGQGITGVSTLSMGSFIAVSSIIFGSALTMKMQYYRMMYEAEATFIKMLVNSLIDFKMLPEKLRSLDA